MAGAALIAFVLLLSSTAWALLAAVSAWLALVWMLSRPDSEPLPAGLVFAALLAGGAFIFALGGGLGLDTALRRAGRAALLVLVATWLRAAARAIGLREVSRRVLGRLRRVPSAPEAAEVLDAIASEGRLAAAGRALAARLSEAPKRPAALLDAVLAWVIREAAAYEPPAPAASLRLRARALDWVLIASAAAPALALTLSSSAHMTTKSEFNGEEWERVARGPVLAGVMVALADRGGSFRESLALGKAYAAAKRDEGGTELLNELVASPPSLDRESAGQPDQIPEQIREAVRIVEEKATPEEAEEYRQFILRLADVVATHTRRAACSASAARRSARRSRQRSTGCRARSPARRDQPPLTAP